MLTKEIRKGMEVWLRNGMRARVEDNQINQSTRLCTVFGADVVRRIARIEGIDSAGPLDDCCCRQFAVIAPPQVAGGGDAIRHESTRNTIRASGMHHDAFPLIRLHTRTSE